MRKIKRALVSVSDKTGLEELVRVLNEFKVEILSTGGTAKLIAGLGIPVKSVSDYTGFPEMLDGRVKTLHPKIHGGLLAIRDKKEHMDQIKKHDIGLIDMVVVNLYPFEKTLPDEAAEHRRQRYLEDAKALSGQIRQLEYENDEAIKTISIDGDDAELESLRASTSRLTAERETLKETAREASAAQINLATLREKHAQLRKVSDHYFETLGRGEQRAALTAELQEAQVELANLGLAEVPDLDALRRAERAAGYRVEAAKTARDELTRGETVLERIAAAESALAECANARNKLASELDLCTALERAYGRDGIPALIVENAAIPAIEDEANRILGELHTDYRVELRTQRELKSGDGLADTLDVIILTGLGERPYESFSGGERSRINVALRIALARLLAHRGGAESRALLLDEIEYLDDEGLAALAEILRGLQGEFETILIVSHAAGLRDAFDQVIEIRKDGGYSEVVA